MSVIAATLFEQISDRIGQQVQLIIDGLAEAREVADAIVFLASARASFITGQTLSVNGGRL